MNNQRDIDRVCVYRGVPKIKKFQKCAVDGREGLIIGGNSSCNFNVAYIDNPKQVVNCHPHWQFEIFNDDRTLLYNHSVGVLS